MADVVIIGAGHNGLAAAVELSRRGLDVAIFDKLPWAGGMAGSKFLAGVRIPVGAYVVGLAPDDLLEALGVSFERHYPDPLAVYKRGDLLARWWLDEEKRFSEMSLLGAPGAREMWAGIRRFHTALRRYIYRLDPPCEEELSRDPVLGEFVEQSSRVFLRRYLPEDLWGMFVPGPYLDQPAFVLGYYNPPRGWYFPSKGGERGSWVLVDELLRRAVDLGAKIFLGTPVKRIVVERGEASGVELADGSRVGARAVLSTASPVNTLAELVDPGLVDEEVLKRLERGSPRLGIRRICAAFKASPALVEDLNPYRGSIIQLDKGEIVVGDRHIVATGGFDLEDLEALSPGLLEKAVAVEIMDSEDIEHVFSARGGAINHLLMSREYMYSCRPVCGWGYRTPVKRLYLGGSGTWPGGQVTCIPGYNAARRIAEDLASGRIT